MARPKKICERIELKRNRRNERHPSVSFQPFGIEDARSRRIERRQPSTIFDPYSIEEGELSDDYILMSGRLSSREVMSRDEEDIAETSGKYSLMKRKETKSLVLLCFVYFLYGASMGFYGPLYPSQARAHEVEMHMYGPVMSLNLFVALLCYPIACRLIGRISCKLGIPLSLCFIGICKIFWGSTARIIDKFSFTLVTYVLQTIEGVSLSTLFACTCFTIYSYETEIIQKRGYITSFSLLGFALSPICGEAIYELLDFNDISYSMGGLIILCGVLFAFIFPVLDQKLTTKDIPFLSCVNKPRMLIYFQVVFSTFIYFGFLTVVLEPYLQQFHLNKLLIGVLFSVPALSCGISAPALKWLSGKEYNSFILICFLCLLNMASLIFIFPPPFAKLDIIIVSVGLLLCGCGCGGKLGCAIYTANRDLKLGQIPNNARDSLLIPTVFSLGGILGYFLGSMIGGFEYGHLNMFPAIFVLLGLEAFTLIVSFTTSMTRLVRGRAPGL